MATFEDPFEGLKKLRQVRDSGSGGGSVGGPSVQQITATRLGGAAQAAGASGGSSPSLGGGPLQAQAERFFASKGWSGAEWGALNRLIGNESGWRATVPNQTGSGAWGLFQFMPMHMRPGGYLPAGRNSTVQQQLEGGYRYIRDRYGTPSRALAHWQRQVPINGKNVGHWY